MRAKGCTKRSREGIIVPSQRAIMPASTDFALRGDISLLECTEEMRMRLRIQMGRDGGVSSRKEGARGDS